MGLPRPLEGAKGRVGGSSPAALVMELRPLAVTIPRAPVAVIAGTEFLELAAAAVAIALLDHIHLEGQMSSNAVEFLEAKRPGSV